MTTTATGQEKGKVSSKVICEMRLYKVIDCNRGSLMAQLVKNLPPMQEMHIRSLGQEDPLEGGMGTHSSILLTESHAHRSLASYSPWVAESGTTEATEHTHTACDKSL